MFGDSLRIQCTYTKDSSKSLGIQNRDYGYLERYSILLGKKKILKITQKFKDQIFVSILLEAIQDSASNHHQEIIQLEKDRVLIIEELMGNSQFTLSHFLIAPIKHLLSDIDLTYDFSSYITEIVDKKDKIIFHENQIIYVLGLLCKSGVQIFEVRQRQIYEFEKIYDLSDIK